ncbi:hypothetical protein BLJAPNOD_06328 [Ensifer sp. M14]|uniref:HEPN domain-containing protein n=1 Tax=Ensifer oleiphilus TaxID=2742698 RepID=A0A7Y6QBX1_9HYPH|nr:MULTISPECIES: hypothetical protein [Ensifer]NVD42807.1 hypothetical protein [Ensifer oleiphilus]RDL46810.1 hypothetical protein BLJAPNOD_06328 [Ensifer sp. M14]
MDLAHPDQSAKVRDILALATQYRDAAVKLGEGVSKPNHIPRRLLALHSIELYLNALLLAKGIDQKTICGFEHDLGERTRIAVNAGLVLRSRTAEHLATLSRNREYIVIRYGPVPTAKLSQINRVMATLDEVSKRVRRMLRAT